MKANNSIQRKKWGCDTARQEQENALSIGLSCIFCIIERRHCIYLF
jgi:hypothetical protein